MEDMYGEEGDSEEELKYSLSDEYKKNSYDNDRVEVGGKSQ